MTAIDEMHAPVAASGRPRRWWAPVLIVMMLAGGLVVVGGTYYYDAVPAPEQLTLRYPTVQVKDLPTAVDKAFVAAVDPDFYGEGLSPSPITRRYAMRAAQDDSTPRSWVMASKLEDRYDRDTLLGLYLNTADYGRGAVGLVAAAQTYFGKQPSRLTVAEAAVLAVQLHPDRPELQAGWAQVLDTMVERGWLSAATRATMILPVIR
jgi:membrane peptidoglycan carboxypeptidase